MRYFMAFYVEAADNITLEQLLGIKEEFQAEWDIEEARLKGVLIAKGVEARAAYRAARSKIQ